MSQIIVFISYSHDSDEHRERVVRLAERLRADGVETRLDRYVNGSPPEGWPRWMLDQLDAANFVLVVCTETYYRRFRGHETSGKGKGAAWEGTLITQEIYAARSKTLKFVPTLFASTDEEFIPEPLLGVGHYTLDSAGYRALHDFLVGVAGIEARPVGPLKKRERDTGTTLVFDDEARHVESPGSITAAGARPLRKYGVTAVLSMLALLAAWQAWSRAPTARTEHPTSVSDGTFLDADWSLTKFTAGLGGGITAKQVLSGGSPGSYRYVNDALNPAPTDGQTHVLSTSIYTPFTFDPAVAGAVTSLSYAEDAACMEGCFDDGQMTGPALQQDGDLYILSREFVFTGHSSTWSTRTLNGLTADNFSLVNLTSTTWYDSAKHPNFGVSGKPLQFGFFRGNSTGVRGGAYTLGSGIDNWKITFRLN